MKYRIIYMHNGERHRSCPQPYKEAKDLVDAGLGVAVVLNAKGYPQIYPNKGGSYELCN